MSVKFLTCPPKTLSQAILSTASTFVLADIEGWDGVDLTSASFGTVAFGAFLSADRTLLELFSFDPTTIASASISFVDRGLAFTGANTVVAANKLDWPAGTTVQLGSDVPQLFSLVGVLANTNAWTGANSFTALPTTTGGNPTTDNEFARKAYVDLVGTGTATTNKVIVAGTAGETILVDKLIYLKISDGRWYLASAGALGTLNNVILGISQGGGTVGVAITSGVLIAGLHTFTTVTLTANTKYYAGDTAGSFSSTTGTIERTVGMSQTTTTLVFTPSFDQQITEDEQDALAGNSGGPSASNTFVTQKGLQIQAEQYAASAAGTDTYAVTLSPVPAAYVNGMAVRFKADVANTGAATLNVNSLGAIAIVTSVGTALATGDIVANQIVQVIYNSTGPVFELVNPASAILLATTYTNGVTTRAGNTASGAQTIAHGLGKTPKKIRIVVTKTNTTVGGPVVSSGTYNGTTNSCVYMVGYDTGNGNTQAQSGNSATQIAYVPQIQPGATGTQVAVATFDGTNITLTWTLTGTVNASDMNIMWEAEG